MPETDYTTIIGETPIAYTVVRSSRRHRTMSMSLDREGRLIVRAPLRTSERTLAEFVRKRARWIARQHAEHHARPQRDPIDDLLCGLDVSLPYRGADTTVIFDREDVRRPAVTYQNGAIRVVAPPSAGNEEVAAALIAWYKRRAPLLIQSRVAAWTEFVGCEPTRILIRDQKTQWGSCGPDGTLRFNWRLAMTAPALLEYVVVHELLHLRIRNHGAGFWREMARLMPNFHARRTRLRDLSRHLPL